jgi:hypothetical protein
MALACVPLVVPMVAWFWFFMAPEGLWRLAERLWPYTLAVTSLIAMPKVQGVGLPVHELVYAILLAGLAIAMPLHAILLFRFRRHIPAWIRSKTGREAERMQTAKPWALPIMYLLWFLALLDILFFGQIIFIAEFSFGHRLSAFGDSMFRLGCVFFLFYVFGLGILQRTLFRVYRDSPSQQADLGR